MSDVPAELQEERLTYILKKFELDKEQQKLFEKSTTAICAGVHDEIGLVETARVEGVIPSLRLREGCCCWKNSMLKTHSTFLRIVFLSSALFDSSHQFSFSPCSILILPSTSQDPRHVSADTPLKEALAAAAISLYCKVRRTANAEINGKAIGESTAKKYTNSVTVLHCCTRAKMRLEKYQLVPKRLWRSGTRVLVLRIV